MFRPGLPGDDELALKTNPGIFWPAPPRATKRPSLPACMKRASSSGPDWSAEQGARRFGPEGQRVVTDAAVGADRRQRRIDLFCRRLAGLRLVVEDESTLGFSKSFSFLMFPTHEGLQITSVVNNAMNTLSLTDARLKTSTGTDAETRSSRH